MNSVITKRDPVLLNSYRDSILLYNTDIPAFGIVFILICLFILIGLVIWSCFSHKNYVSIGHGSSVSMNKNYIMSDYTGKILKMYIREGSIVEEGDLLIELQTTDISMQKMQIEGQIANNQRQISQYKKLVQSFIDDTNYFDSTNPDDMIYYYQYELYKSQINQNSIDVNSYKGYGYSELQIEMLIDQNQGKLDQIFYTSIHAALEKINDLESSVEILNNQIDALGSGSAAYSIYASSSGIVHMDNQYREGMVISAGSAIGSIANENTDYEIISYISLGDRPLIHEGDSCNISIQGLNQSVYGTLNGTVLQIESDVTNINGDNGVSDTYFKIHIKPANNYLVSKSGKQVALSNGMSVETRVIYDEVTYFDYALEALGLLVR